MLKIVGGDEPTLLSLDTDTNEVSDEYVINKATALALAANGPRDERTDRRIAFFEGQAQRAYRKLPTLSNVREVE
jgi:hypothetical protein